MSQPTKNTTPDRPAQLRSIESTVITHRRWLLAVGVLVGVAIGIGAGHAMPYSWWSFAVIAVGVAAVFAEMGAAVWWYRVVAKLDELRRYPLDQ